MTDKLFLPVKLIKCQTGWWRNQRKILTSGYSVILRKILQTDPKYARGRWKYFTRTGHMPTSSTQEEAEKKMLCKIIRSKWKLNLRLSLTRCSFILYLRLTKKSHRMPISRRGRHCCPGLVTRFMGQEQPSLKGVWIRIFKKFRPTLVCTLPYAFSFFFYLFILSFDQSLLLGLLRQWWIRLVLEYMRNNNEPDCPRRNLPKWENTSHLFILDSFPRESKHPVPP